MVVATGVRSNKRTRVAAGRRAAVIEWAGSNDDGGERGNEGRRWPGSCDAGEGKQGALFLSHRRNSNADRLRGQSCNQGKAAMAVRIGQRRRR
ncbi:hypothetical protein C4D60_Mb10t12500 [Musa balbisiana]|uniref:Uncharacterized protein n=1 Tax=Musa balbisiana TaxID=52838 RepID=A0A4S8IXZ8_MUSBA|nr:hypothetical protein C4D60_Mb10t12500 [Musa balbisiana]